MASIPSCSIEVQKYVELRKCAITHSRSAWERRRYQFVQSPVLDISGVSCVPVKRLGGDGDNSVCFLSKGKIENISSDFYHGEFVQKGTTRVNSHGVAIVDNDPDCVFKYQRGHQFWICLDGNTNSHKTTAPVINLQTCGFGVIPLEHVCWYPSISGPRDELWTLGGELRKLKHTDSRKSSSLSWAICQKLDGSHATVENLIQLPENGTQKAEKGNQKRCRLSKTQSDKLFIQRYQSMLPTLPPLNLKPVEDVLYLSTQPCVPSLKLPLNMLPHSHIHPQTDNCPNLLLAPGFPPINGQDAEVVTASTEVMRESRETDQSTQNQNTENGQPAFSMADPVITNNPTYGGLPKADRIFNTSMCNTKDPTCKYSSMILGYHFHPPTSRCLNTSHSHEHCVSQVQALLGGYYCVLHRLPTGNDQCCYWKEKDRQDGPPPAKRQSEETLLQNVKRRGEIVGRSCSLERSEDENRPLCMPESELGCVIEKRLFSDMIFVDGHFYNKPLFGDSA
ncbi:hypothetical protein B7494_g6190 [Chlorociboria aeruginascens]|nr:hypothetical protein B7494_g6190 [Chlorociboria aeruginascens]